MARYVMATTDAAGAGGKERVTFQTPPLRDVAAFGDGYQSGYVSVTDERGAVTLYGRTADGPWTVVAADVDAATAGELGRWFEVTVHLGGSDDAAAQGPRMAARAVSLVVERIRARHLDYPTQDLAADRFTGGWSVYAAVDVDDSDPTAFLDMPVGRSVFLVGDTGRVKEISSSVPPRQAEELFTAQEAYVRRPLGTFDAEVIAARSQGLLGPLAQQLALLGPPGLPAWDRFRAVFSFTVSAEVAHLRFWTGERSFDVPVPETLALLVRRQRHLAASMPAGPWLRLQLALTHTTGMNAQIATEYDYGDRTLPHEELLSPANYRDDLAAYPRPHAPSWLAAYVAGGTPPASAPATARTAAPAPATRTTTPPPPAPARKIDTRRPEPPQPQGPRPERPWTPAPPPPAPAVPVLDTKIGSSHLFADAMAISFGRKSIRLHEVEYVCFSANRIAEKRFMYPTTYRNEWHFQVGRYPYSGGPHIRVPFLTYGRQAQQPPQWLHLMEWAEQLLLPRLLDELITRVRQGQTVQTGGSVHVSREGIACTKPRIALVPWSALSQVQISNGMVVIHRAGTDNPLLTIPLSHPNAVLIPDLFTALA
ncbi:hypothetical protein [Streptomyces sp. NBC_00448]|uniref:hypothetical protein n=1 Tax=Streptomyces sp. NBC_00448 TaxID=2903652 RepID=UPI002E1A5803